MNAARGKLVAVLALMATAGAASVAGQPGVVDARDYQSFWLWSGVRSQAVLDTAEQVYLLDGEVEGGGARFLSRRAAPPRVAHAKVWLVVRTDSLEWTPDVYAELGHELLLWRRANDVVGVQIDFDARTRHLATYAAFLKDLRLRLPRECRLGITGLLDWSANGDPAGLDALAGVVDEAVLQIYQGRHVVPGYATYLAHLDRIRVPFRIGLLQGGEWRPPPSLKRNPLFRGYVVFLRNG